jgi:hypothetical protein
MTSDRRNGLRGAKIKAEIEKAGKRKHGWPQKVTKAQKGDLAAKSKKQSRDGSATLGPGAKMKTS